MTLLHQSLLSIPAAVNDPAVPDLADAIVRARSAVALAASDSLAIPESALEKPWVWNGRDPGDGVRYGLYRAAETIEDASVELEAALAGAPARSRASILISQATIARWALQGRLAGLADEHLDRVAKDGEWTARQTLAHTINGQRGYGLFSRWWLAQPLGDSRPARMSPEAADALDAELPTEDAEGVGSLSDLRARLDAVLDEWGLRFAGLDEEALAASATWAGIPVDIGFRLLRWGSHIAEHTIQLDKTLDWLGYSPTEPARVVGTMLATWGRLEARIFPVAPAGTEATIGPILDRMASTLVTEARTVRAAAEA